MDKHTYDPVNCCCVFDADAPIHDMSYQFPEQGSYKHGRGLTYQTLRAANVKRCHDSFDDHLAKWSPNDWMTAVVGELGELANLLKKIHRGYDLTKGMTKEQMQKELAKEWADTMLYLDLLGASLGIDPDEALTEKFNEVSKRVNSPIRL